MYYGRCANGKLQAGIKKKNWTQLHIGYNHETVTKTEQDEGNVNKMNSIHFLA